MKSYREEVFFVREKVNGFIEENVVYVKEMS